MHVILVHLTCKYILITKSITSHFRTQGQLLESQSSNFGDGEIVDALQEQ